MSRLLAADITRMIRNKVLWIAMILMAGMAVLLIADNTQVPSDINPGIEGIFYAYGIYIGFGIAVFAGLFIGTEYSDGTIRNKLAVGHSRAAVYGSQLITCMLASLLMLAAYVIPVIMPGMVLIGGFTIPAGTVLAVTGGTLMTTFAFVSIFTLMCMLIHNKAVAAVSVILTIIIMFFINIYISQILAEPEFHHLSAAKKVVLETIIQILPTGQGLFYANLKATGAQLWQWPLYSAAIVTITTGIGIIAFKRKDIK